MMSEWQTSDGRTHGGNALEMKKPPGSVDGTVPGVERRIERMLDSYEAAAILRIHPRRCNAWQETAKFAVCKWASSGAFGVPISNGG
jgi:hypothetical protein